MSAVSVLRPDARGRQTAARREAVATFAASASSQARPTRRDMGRTTSARGSVRQQHRAVEPAGEEHRRRPSGLRSTGYSAKTCIRHQTHRLLLRPPTARLRRHLQTSARPQRRRRKSRCGPTRSTTATWSCDFSRHQADRQGLDRPRARSQDDPAPRRSARRAAAAARRADVRRATAIPRWSISPNCSTTTPTPRGFRSCASPCGKPRRHLPPTAGQRRERSAGETNRRARFAVFDLDGTLIDSRRDLSDSANEMLAEIRRCATERRNIVAWSAAARRRW